MNIGIIDYGSGNLHSVHNAVKTAAQDLKGDVKFVQYARELSQCDYVILPGVGHFATCRNNLTLADGMEHELEKFTHDYQRPFLGICVGMQLMADSGYEGGECIKGLGWIKGEVKHFETKMTSKSMKIPHIGWNELHVTQKTHPICRGIEKDCFMYFVHSYIFDGVDEGHVLAKSDYGDVRKIEFVSMIAKDNMLGTQFHPEKSQLAGQKLLKNFLQWKP